MYACMWISHACIYIHVHINIHCTCILVFITHVYARAHTLDIDAYIHTYVCIRTYTLYIYTYTIYRRRKWKETITALTRCLSNDSCRRLRVEGVEGGVLVGGEAEAEGRFRGEGEEEVHNILKDLKLWNTGVLDDLQEGGGGGGEEEEEAAAAEGVDLLTNNE
jgi:hypothetical protein